MTRTPSTSDRWSRWLALAAVAVAFLLQVTAIVLAYLARGTPVTSLNIALFDRAVLYVPATIAWQIMGALVAIRQPRNPIGWLFLVSGLCSALGGFAEAYWRVALWVYPGSLPWGEAMLWLDTRPYEIITLITVWIVLLFPNGRLLSRGWLAAGLAASLGVVLMLWASPAGTADPSRWAGVGADPNDAAISLGILLQIVGTAAAVFALGIRWRRSRGVERQQMKVMVTALAVYVISLVVLVMRIAAFAQILTPWLNLAFAFGAGSTVLVAAATAFAILRYRIWDIDIILRRTLLYSALTLSLGAVYLVVVVALQALFVRATGSENPLAVVASTLAIAALFQPLRRWVQAVIDRRFFRRTHDNQRVLEGFGRRAQREADLDSISADLLTTVSDTLEPDVVTLWMRR